MGRKSHTSNVTLADLSPAAQAQLGDAELNRFGRRQKQGRIKVSKPELRTVDGIVFASILEAKFYTHLKKSIPAGELHLQPEFLLQDKFRDLEGNMVRTIVYKADFLLGPARVKSNDPLNPDNIVIDAKGHLTEIFRIKAKMFMYHYRDHKLYLVKTLKALDEVIFQYMERR
jgi:hypothetical protein